MDAFSGALMGHLVGDYILQDDWMATEKKKSSFICFLHAFIWGACIIACSGFAFNTMAQCVVLVASHFVIDRWSLVPWFMRSIGKKGFLEPPFAPWSIILVDNILHLFTIYILLVVNGL